MELLQLKYFCEAVKMGSFSAVAKEYMVPPSSVSHTISRLENELGTELFSRTGNKIALNDYGYAFYENISSAIEKIENGKRIISCMQEQSVSIIVRQGGYSIVPMLTVFREKYPEFKLFFPFKSLEQKGSFFIRISTKPFENDEDFISIPLFEDRILVALSDSNPLSKKDALDFEDIKDLPLVWFNNFPEEKSILDYFKSHDARPNILLECNKDSFAAELVKNDFGIVFYPESTHPIEKSEGIVTLSLKDFNVKRTIYASWPKKFVLNEASKTFLDFAVDYFKKT